MSQKQHYYNISHIEECGEFGVFPCCADKTARCSLNLAEGNPDSGNKLRMKARNKNEKLSAMGQHSLQPFQFNCMTTVQIQ